MWRRYGGTDMVAATLLLLALLHTACAEDAAVTVHGCSCKEQWTFAGQSLHGCASPDDDPRGPWCPIVNTTDCAGHAGVLRGRDNATLGYYDYCNSPAPADDGAAAVAHWAAGLGGDTQAGCTCLQNWSFHGSNDMQGCANPDQDGGGAWCMVEIDSCSLSPAGNVTEADTLVGYWDYCIAVPDGATSTEYSTAGEPSGEVTAGGCECRADWRYGKQDLTGCSNPDGDPNGSWCAITADPCVGSGPAGNITSNNGDVVGWYDYCNTTTAAVAAAVVRTQRNCTCKLTWTYGGQQVAGCANPDDDPKGSWCIVDGTSCHGAVLPRNLTNAAGDVVGYWDHCSIADAAAAHNTSATSQRTHGGCQCAATWFYDPNKPLSGCANPDGDAEGTWCVVVPDTCAASNTTGTMPDPNTFELRQWDYCVAASHGVASKSPNGTTLHGCACLSRWTYGGSTFQHCANPNDDANGLWCAVVASQCDSTPAGVDWDYCANETVKSGHEEQSRLGPAGNIETSGGCKCLALWNAHGRYAGCSNPDDDPVGSWCMVDPKRCDGNGPRGTLHSGGWWDRCDNATANTFDIGAVSNDEQSQHRKDTRGGCKCQKHWVYNNSMLSGCQNPDADVLGAWCAVDISTCESVVAGFPLNWDYCHSASQ